MKDFKASDTLCTMCVDDLKSLFNEAGETVPYTDEVLKTEMRKHVADMLNFSIRNYSKYLQYAPEKTVTFFDENGFNPELKKILKDRIIYVDPEQEDLFFDLLHEEITKYATAKGNPVLKSKWGRLEYNDGKLTTHLLPRQKRNLDDFFTP
jgi:hypothetical protein